MSKFIRPIIGLILFLIAWEMAAINFHNGLLPTPVEVASELFRSLFQREIYIHSLFSISRVLVGFSVAIVSGVGLGLLLGHYKLLGQYFTFIIELIRPIPPIAWIPLSILFFGLGNLSAFFIVFIGSFFPIFTNTYFGASSLPKILQNVAGTFEIRGFVFFRKILFKYSLPYIFSGLKTGLGIAWMSVIAAELIGAQSGLGYYIQLNRLMLRMDNVLLGMLLIGFIGLLLSKILDKLEVFAIPWKK